MGSDNNWRLLGSDPIYYLSGRESIYDAIYTVGTVQQRRKAPNVFYANGNYHGQPFQPYVLHTTDEYSTAFYNVGAGNVVVPSHAIAFRTVDLTVNRVNPDGFMVQGGGKLGMYSFWDLTNASSPTHPLGANQQYEFYDYSSGNLGEIGNDFWSDTVNAAAFQSAFASIAPSELYNVAGFTATYNTALNRYLVSES